MLNFEKVHEIQILLNKRNLKKEKIRQGTEDIEKQAKVLLDALKAEFPEYSDKLDDIFASWSTVKEQEIKKPSEQEEEIFGYALPYHRDVYESLLPLSELMFNFEKNGNPAQHAYKLACIFDNVKDALAYVAAYKNKNPDSIHLMHNANLFRLPQVEDKSQLTTLTWVIWRKMAVKHLNNELFRDYILPQAIDIESSIQESAEGKKFQFLILQEARKKVEDLNADFKKLHDTSSRITEEDERRFQALPQLLSEAKMALANTPMRFEATMPLVDLNAHIEKLAKQEDTPVYQLFTKWGLTKADYNRFKSLERRDNDTQIPKLMIDGAGLDYPGYYFMKVPVMDEMHAARAACLGRMTNCCQSLSGEAGQPCVIHGLTSPNGGFYVLCQGDPLNPQVSDPVIAQSWAWRSRDGAIVCDSIESRSVDDFEIQMVTDFYRKFAMNLVKEGQTHKVVCGESSGISRNVASKMGSNSIERFLDYKAYSDSESQLVIFEKDKPFYLYGVDVESTFTTLRFLQESMKNKDPLIYQATFVEALTCAIRHDHVDLINEISKIAQECGRTYELDRLSAKLEQISSNRFTLLHKACQDGDKIFALELIEKGADINSSDAYGKTPLLKALSSNQHDVALKLIEKGADVTVEDNTGADCLFYAKSRDMNDIVRIIQEKTQEMKVAAAPTPTPVSVQPTRKAPMLLSNPTIPKETLNTSPKQEQAVADVTVKQKPS